MFEQGFEDFLQAEVPGESKIGVANNFSFKPRALFALQQFVNRFLRRLSLRDVSDDVGKSRPRSERRTQKTYAVR